MLSNHNDMFLKNLFNIHLFSNDSNKNINKKTIDDTRRNISKKVGRNEPCPCGSGKKYKQCHGS